MLLVDTLLVKIFATALTLSQVTTAPDMLKTHFDPVQDRQQVVDLLRAGCAQVRKAFDIETVNLDDLIATALEDPDAVVGSRAAFRGIDIGDLHIAYRQFCKNETVPNSPIDLGEVIAFYNRTLADLPDHTHLRDAMQAGASIVLDDSGKPLGQVFAQEQRRISVPLADIPEHVQKAFVAAEDKRFYEHKGIDEHAVIRAFMENLSQSGRPQGGSTITQQVVKNLLLGEDVTYERKIREMVLASRVEHTFSKPEILELYLNSIFLGRGSWGVELAAHSYFGKSASALTLGEGALLAALAKGPAYFDPVRHPDRAKDRLSYVLRRMQEDGAITAEDANAVSWLPTLVPYKPPQTAAGSYFTDYVAREIRTASDLSAFRRGSTTVHSTLDSDLQQATESALQEGLARYEQAERRVDFRGPEANLAAEINRLDSGPRQAKPSWQQALESARLPLSDVHWNAAVVIGKSDRRTREGSIRVGLADGSILPLAGPAAILRTLKLYDVVLVRVAERKGRAARAELRVRPEVQGAAMVLENKTGRILAMTGGFSHALSQLNRATQSERQPGSALKPLTYLAALQKGLQPNTLVRDRGITFAPINRGTRDDYWSPRNYDGGSLGLITLRQALENSRNQATASLLRGIEAKPELSLDRICGLALELRIYKDCVRYYPFVLGAQPVRPIDLTAFYATIANGGDRPLPYAIETIEENGKIVYRHQPATVPTASADPASFYQLKTMLQGVVQHGTAHAISDLAPYIAGKTGTSEDENDAWFVGFTNDVTVTVWVGYDNGAGRRRTLGAGQTGAHVALPIFESMVNAVWTHYPEAPLDPPSPAAKRLLVMTAHEERARGYRRRARTLVEYLRKDAEGLPVDTRYALLSPRGHDGVRSRHARNRFFDRRRSMEADTWTQPDWRGRGGDWRERAQSLGQRELPPGWRGVPSPGGESAWGRGNGWPFGFRFGHD